MIFFDSYAILEIIRGNPNYRKFGDLTLITGTLNLAEVFYSLLKETGEKQAKKIIEKVKFEFIEISEAIAIRSSIFRYKNRSKKLSYTDCIGYITARKNNMRFLTGDQQFQEMKHVLYVK